MGRPLLWRSDGTDSHELGNWNPSMMTDRKRVLSGMQPSGLLHLGNWLGALENWRVLQEQYECFFFVADWHALHDKLCRHIRRFKEFAARCLSIGSRRARSQRSTIFIQSRVPHHAVLYLLLIHDHPRSVAGTKPHLQGKAGRDLKGRDLSAHTGSWVIRSCRPPISSSISRILVPVGKDQLPHLELTRELARRFNSCTARLPGT